jgi:hypothetical protein
MVLGEVLTNAEIEEYFGQVQRMGFSYKDKVASGLSSSLQAKVKDNNVIDILAIALGSPDWNIKDKGKSRVGKIKQWALDSLRNGSDGVLGNLSKEDAKFVEEHQREYKVIIGGGIGAADPNFDANNDILKQKIAESKTAKDTAAAEGKATEEQRKAAINAVNKTEVKDFIAAHLNDPADPTVQVFRNMYDAIHPRATSPNRYTAYLNTMTNDADLLDAINTYIETHPDADFTPEFLSKIMTSGTYKYPEVMNGGSGTKYCKANGTATPAYDKMQKNFGDIRTNTLAKTLGATPPNTRAIAQSADAYNGLIGTMADGDAEKTKYTAAVTDAKTKEEAARTAAAERATAISAANTNSVIDFIRENYNDESMIVYQAMVNNYYAAKLAATLPTGAPAPTIADLNMQYPNRYTEFLDGKDDSVLINELFQHVGTIARAGGSVDLRSPALLAQILTSDTYKYEELLTGAPSAATTPVFNAIHNRFGNVCRNNALSPLTLDDKDTLFINYNLQELAAIIDANPNDPRKAAYKDILQRQSDAFDSIFPREKYPNGITDPAVRQMLLKMKFNRYRSGNPLRFFKGENTNVNAIKHNLNALIGADGASAIMESTGAYGNAINAAYGRQTLPSIKGDVALIAQNKLLEVMCKKNGMNQKETDAVMRKTANFNNEGMASVGSLIKLGVKSFLPAAGISALITAVSTVSPPFGMLVGAGFAAHSMVKMGIGEFNAAKERLTQNGIEPSNKEVWADAWKSGMFGRMVRQAIPTLVAYIGPSVPIIGPILRANPHFLPLAFAAKAGLEEGTRSYNQGATLFQSILRGAAAGTGGYLGGRLGRFAGTTVGNSFNEGYASAGVKQSEGLLGTIRGGLSGLKHIGSDITRTPGVVMAGLGVAGAGAAAVVTETPTEIADDPKTGETATERTDTTATRTGTTPAGRVDLDGNGYDDRYQSWANKDSDPNTMFKGGRYVDADGKAINPHDMNVKPGSFRWVSNEQSSGSSTSTDSTATNKPDVRIEYRDRVEYRDRIVKVPVEVEKIIVDGKYGAAEEAAMENKIAWLESKLQELDSAKFPPDSVKTPDDTGAEVPEGSMLNGSAFGEYLGLNK